MVCTVKSDSVDYVARPECKCNDAIVYVNVMLKLKRWIQRSRNLETKFGNYKVKMMT